MFRPVANLRGLNIVVIWRCRQSYETGRDSFLMGPSGYGFLHPSAIDSNSSLLMNFVQETVAAAKKLDMSSFVHWDVDGNDLSHALR